MSMTDVRSAKMSLRRQYRAIRQQMPLDTRRLADTRIAEQIVTLQQYKDSAAILTYVSTDIEVDTWGIIRRALEDGKQVAVPRCIDVMGLMAFYRITSVDELHAGSFGVPEPPADSQRLMSDFSSSICLVPALSYDHEGYRLGYGKGYYDRFLANYDGCAVGICYSNCVQDSLPHDRFDRRVSLLVTEQYIRSTDI